MQCVAIVRACFNLLSTSNMLEFPESGLACRTFSLD